MLNLARIYNIQDIHEQKIFWCDPL